MPGQGPDRQAHNASEKRISTETVGLLEQSWVTPTAGAALDPVVSDAGVHVLAPVGASEKSRAYGIDRNGTIMWELPDPFFGRNLTFDSLLAQGDEVSIGSSYGGVRADHDGVWVDAASGEILRDGDDYSTIRGNIGVYRQASADVNYTVYELLVTRFDDPSLSWSGRMSVSTSGPNGPLTLGRDRIYSNEAGWVAAYSLDELTPEECPFPDPPDDWACPEWRTQVDGGRTVSPVVSTDQKTVYVGTDAGTLWALDAVNGSVLWKAPVGAAINSAPALADGNLFVPTDDGDLVVLDANGCGAATCEPAWTASTGSKIVQQPAVGGGVVFAVSANGELQAYAAAGCGSATCDELWSDDVGGEWVTGAPAIDNGMIFVGTDVGLVAYGLPE